MGNTASESAGVCIVCSRALLSCKSSDIQQQYIEGRKYNVYHFHDDEQRYYDLVDKKIGYICSKCLFDYHRVLHESQREHSLSLQHELSKKSQLVSFDLKGMKVEKEYLLHEAKNATVRRSEFEDSPSSSFQRICRNGENAGRTELTIDKKELEKALLKVPCGTEIRHFPCSIVKFLNEVECKLYSLPRRDLDWIISFSLDLFARQHNFETKDFSIVSADLVAFVVESLGQKPLLVDLINFSQCLIMLFNSTANTRAPRVGCNLTSVFVEKMLEIPLSLNSCWISTCQKYYTHNVLHSINRKHNSLLFYLLRTNLWNKKQLDKLSEIIAKSDAKKSSCIEKYLNVIKTLNIHGSEEVLKVLESAEERQENVYPALKDLLLKRNIKTVENIWKELKNNEMSQEKLDDIHDAFTAVRLALQKPVIRDPDFDCFEELQNAVNTLIDDSPKYFSNYMKPYIVPLICAAWGINHFMKYWPRHTQLIGCLMLLSQREDGMLLEIRTGEGKSCVIAMLAVVLCLQKHKVDIVTSSAVLASRDSKEWNKYFQYYQTGIATNISGKWKENSATCYKKDIVIGTVETFCGDILRQDFHQEETRGQREYDVVIADEVDYMLLDRGIQFTYLSNDVIGIRHIEPVLSLIWYQVTQYAPVRYDERTLLQQRPFPFYFALNNVLRSIYGEDAYQQFTEILTEAERNNYIYKGCCTDIENILRGEELNNNKCLAKITKEGMVGILTIAEAKAPIKFIVYDLQEDGNYLTKYEKHSKYIRTRITTGDCEIPLLLCSDGQLSDLHEDYDKLCCSIKSRVLSNIDFESSKCDPKNEKKNDQNALILIPNFLKPLVENMIPVWIKNAFEAKNMQEEREYIVHDNSILPIDFMYTGEIELTKRWGDGLQQFLEMKHLLPLSAMTITTNFLSNVAFFKKYKKILGLTGTLGSKTDKNFLQKEYKTNLCTIPTYKKSQFVNIEGKLTRKKSEWFSEICLAIEKEVLPCEFRSKGRAALIMCEDIITSKEVKMVIEKKFGSDIKSVSLYTKNEASEAQLIKNILGPKEIIIATNLAGRGTDVKVSPEVNENGGLFVLITFLPLNKRVELQAKGRTARQGNLGSAQMIVMKDHLEMKEDIKQDSEFQVIQRMRDEKERIRKVTFETQVKEVLIKDNLFKAFCDFLQKTKADLHFIKRDKLDIIFHLLHEKWGIWLKINSTVLTANSLEEKLKAFLSELTEVVQKCNRETISGNVYNMLEYSNNMLFDGDCAKALKQLNKAISVDKIWASIAYYNKAFCLLYMQNDNFIQESIHCLDRSLELLSHYFHELQITMTLVQNATPTFQKFNSEQNSFMIQMQIRFQILVFFKQSITAALTKLKEIPSLEKNEITLHGKAIFSIFSNVDNPTFQKELQIIWNRGLRQIFSISENQTFAWSQMWVVTVGFSQVVVGALLVQFTTGILTPVCTNLIMAGISDIVGGTFGIIVNKDVDMKDWGFQKGMQIAIMCLLPVVQSYVNIGLSKIPPLSEVRVDDIKKAFEATSAALYTDAANVITNMSFKNALKESGKLIASEFCSSFLIKLGKEFLDPSCMEKIFDKFEKLLSSSFEDGILKFVQSKPITELTFQIASAYVMPQCPGVVQWNKVVDIHEVILKTALEFYKNKQETIHKVLSSISSVAPPCLSMFQSTFKSTNVEPIQLIIKAISRLEGVSALSGAITFSMLYSGLQKDVEKRLQDYCEENEPKIKLDTSEKVNIRKELSKANIRIARLYIKLISKEVRTMLEEHVAEKIFSISVDSLSVLLKEKVGFNKAKENVMARAHGRFIAHASLENNEIDDTSSKREKVIEYAKTIENEDTPMTLLEARVLSYKLNVNVNIMEEKSNGTFETLSNIENSERSGETRSLTLVFRNGKYGVLEGLKPTVSPSLSLLEAIAIGSDPCKALGHTDEITRNYRKLVSTELRDNPNWDEFYNRRTITMQLEGGSKVLLQGSA